MTSPIRTSRDAAREAMKAFTDSEHRRPNRDELREDVAQHAMDLAAEAGLEPIGFDRMLRLCESA